MTTIPPVPKKDNRVNETLAWLKKNGSVRIREQMSTQFAIHAPKSFGLKMAAMQQYAKRLGRDHDLAAALWATGWYEARTIAAFVDDPAQVTPAQMDRWCRDFDNWGICDTVCFKLFDQTPHAFRKVKQWATHRDEFVKRASFALLASLALHDKKSGDEPFVRCLPLIEKAATDDRNFVKKGVSWALRTVGRRSAALNAASLDVAQRLAASDDASSRWIGKDALKDLTRVSAASKGRKARSAEV